MYYGASLNLHSVTVFGPGSNGYSITKIRIYLNFYLLVEMDTRLFDQQLFRAIYQSKDLISSSICHTEGGSLIWSDSTLARVGRCVTSRYCSVNIVASPGKCAGNFNKTEELISSPSTTDQVVYVPLHDWHETSSNDMNHQGKRGDVSETCSLDTLISVCRREGAYHHNEGCLPHDARNPTFCGNISWCQI